MASILDEVSAELGITPPPPRLPRPRPILDEISEELDIPAEASSGSSLLDEVGKELGIGEGGEGPENAPAGQAPAAPRASSGEGQSPDSGAGGTPLSEPRKNAPFSELPPASQLPEVKLATGLLRGIAQGFNQAQEMGPQFRQAFPSLDITRLWRSDEEARADAVADLIKQQQEAASYIPPDLAQSIARGQAEYRAASGVLGKIKALKDNPDFFSNIIGSSIGQSLPSIAAGYVAGRGGRVLSALGVGAVSGGQEYLGSIFDFLAENKHVDLSDPEQIEAAIQNPEWMKEAKAFAVKRGVPTGVADTVTSLIAPMAVGTVARRLGRAVEGVAGSAPTTLSKTAGIATGLGLESAGGVAGEAGASLWSTGTVDMGDLILEGIGEFAGGAGELASTLSARGREGFGGGLTRPTEQDILEGHENIPEIVSTPEEAEGEGRTLYGWASKDSEDPIALGTYEEAERQAGEKGVRNGKLIAARPEDTTSVYSYDKMIKLAPQERAKLEVKGSPEATESFHKLLTKLETFLTAKKLAKPAQKKVPEIVGELDNLITTHGLEVPEGIDVTRPIFTGNTRNLGVSFRQINYGGLALTKGRVPKPNDPIGGHPASDEFDDIDLSKISPGTLIPSGFDVVRFIQNQGEVEFRRLAEPYSSPEAVEFAIEIVRNKSTDSADGKRLTDSLNDGSLKLAPDARVVGRTAVRIANTQEAAAEVEKARVPIIGRLKNGPGRVFPHIQGRELFSRTADDKPGTVNLLDTFATLEKSPYKDLIRSSVEVMDRLIKQWKLPYNLTVIHRGLNPTLTSGNQWVSSGSHMNMESSLAPNAIIQLDEKQVQTEHDVLQILFHEFAHFLSGVGFWELKPEVRTKIMAAYRRYVLTTNSLSVPEVIRRGGIPLRITNPDWHSDYIYSFEEWFAEQIARWAITQKAPLGMLASIVKPIARRMIQAAKAFAKLDPTNRMRPEPEIVQWLESTLSGRVKVDWFPALSAAHNRQTTLANARAMQGQSTGEATPMTPQSVGIRLAVSKLGGEVAIHGVAAQTGQPLPPINRLLAQTDRFNWMYKWLLALPHVAERNLHIQPLQVYRELIQLMQLESQRIMVGASDRLEQWQKQSRVQQHAIGKLLFSLTQMTYLTAQERAQGVVRQPTSQELVWMVRQFRLSRESVRIFQGIRDDFRASLDRYVGELRVAAGQITDPAVQAQRMAEINRMHRLLLQKPYFPFTRYGTWSLTVWDPLGKVENFLTFETKRALKQAAKEAYQRYPNGSGYKVREGVLSEEVRSMLGIPPQMLDLMAQTLNLNPAQTKALEQLKFQLSPAQSFKKRFLSRKETAGWSEDAIRNYAHYMFHHAKHYTRVKYEGPLREQIKQVRSVRSSGDATKTDRIANYLEQHAELVLNPREDWSGVRSAAAIWWLGFVPQSAILNLTQLPLATYPFLAGKFGDVVTMGAMTTAALDLRGLYTKKAIKRIAGAEFRALSEAMEEGLIDESQAAELAAIAEGSRLLAGVSSRDIKQKWGKISQYAMMMFQASEQYNRRVTFRTAWKLAQANPQARWLQELATKHSLQYQRLISRGWSGQEAISFLAGKDAVLSTQYEYARYARPKIMQGRASVVFMFQLFTLNQMFMLWNNKSAIPRFMLVMMFMGGMMGLPGLEDAEELIRALASLYGKDFDIEKEARKYIVEVTGDKFAADVILRGSGRVGFGIPQLMDSVGVTWAPQIDMSRQIGMGRILPINPAVLVGSPGRSAEEAFSKGIQDSAGAAFGIGFNIWKALQDSQSTPFLDPKTWERAMPRSMKNVSKAFRLGSEGRERDARGATVTPFDTDDPEQLAELVLLSGGFQPTRLARDWDERIATLEANNFWMARRGLVLNSIFKSVQNNDPEARQEAFERLREFNKEVPDKSFVISQETIQTSLKNRLTGLGKAEAGLPRGKVGIGLSLEMQRLYPNSIGVQKLRTLEQGGE